MTKTQRTFIAVVATVHLSGLVSFPILKRATPGSRAFAAEASKIYHGIGVVTGVDPQEGLLTIDHKAIPGLMDAMEMEYRTNPRTLASGLAKGDAVEFALDAKTLAIVWIKKVARP